MARENLTPTDGSRKFVPRSQLAPQGRYHEKDQSKYAVTISAPVEKVYAFFRQLENLPSFMKDLKRIDVVSDKKSHWVAEVKGIKAEWDAEITEETANEMIAWKSIEGSEVQTSGAIFFRPAPEGRGTVVSLTYDFKIPGGKLAEFITFFTGDHPNELAFVNLRRLKARVETGEVPTVEGQPSGRDEDAETLKH